MSKLWGARFNKKSDPWADLFTFSISYDHRLAKYDVVGSIAHARMLAKQRIIPKTDAAKIISGLKKILLQIEAGKFKYDPKAEDIHTDIQNRLKAIIGKALAPDAEGWQVVTLSFEHELAAAAGHSDYAAATTRAIEAMARDERNGHGPSLASAYGDMRIERSGRRRRASRPRA